MIRNVKNIVPAVLFLLFAAIASAQNKVNFVIDHTPVYTIPGTRIYLAGSFNNWNPRDEKYILKKIDNKTGITLDLPAGRFEYKFTKGSWSGVEVTDSGKPQPNRIMNISGDTTINIEIKEWSDHFQEEKKHSTASRNVHILDNNFLIPQLNRHRRIWIYLPESYKTSKKRYPVLYMQDGQNVFDEQTSFSGEWAVDEFLDSMENKERECIVVAIDNGGEKRINEYSPYNMEKYGTGEGKLYAAFLVKTLKPYIDQHYRTKKQKEHTWVAGSSLGGLISFYAILKYPSVFGGAGVFSPAFWIAPQLDQDVVTLANKVKGKIYFYAGKQEGESMVPDVLGIVKKMQEHSAAKMEIEIKDGGQHNESNWRAQFPHFYEWIFKKN